MSTLEHVRWKGNNSPSYRGSVRNTKYRSMDALSKRPMARASFFFSPETTNPDGLLSGLPGLQRRGSQRVLDAGSNESIRLRRGSSVCVSRSGSMRMGDAAESFRLESSGTPTNNRQNGRAAVTFTPASFDRRPPLSDSIVQTSFTSNEPSALPLVEGRLSSPPLRPSSLSDGRPQYPGRTSMQEITRLCPTPTSGTQITSSVLDLKSFGAASMSPLTYELPSLTQNMWLRRRAETPVVKGKTRIARLIDSNRALVGFEEEPIEDPHRAASSLM